MKQPIHTCPTCQAEFIPAFEAHTYCSSACWINCQYWPELPPNSKAGA